MARSGRTNWTAAAGDNSTISVAVYMLQQIAMSACCSLRGVDDTVLVAPFQFRSLRDNLNIILYDTRCYFNVRSKADMSQLNLPHGNDN